MFTGTDPLRATKAARRLIYRDPLSKSDLCQVVLLKDEGSSGPTRAPSFFLHEIAELTARLKDLGIRNVKLFTKESEKTERAELAVDDANLMCRALREFRRHDADLYIATETCLCAYTKSGACGVHNLNGAIDLNTTVDLFARMSVLHANNGASAVGPAGMIEGTVRACREALDQSGFATVGVMPHMIFRTPFYYLYRAIMNTGDGESRDAFQIDPFNATEYVRSYNTLIDEGADIILVEPALFVLDIISNINRIKRVPIGCFSVSGEYELMKYGASNEDRARIAALEFCRAAKRAGVEFIATYAAMDVAASIQ